jgi:hypothetical protein
MRTLASLPTIERSIAEFDRESRDLTERAERWLAAMSGVVAPPPPAPKLPALSAEASRTAPAAAPPVSWQGGVGALTQGVGVPGEGGGETQLNEQLVMKLDAGDLGELSFALDRSSDGIRVIIGADGRNAQSALGAERETLLAALRRAGLPTHSVTVVPSERLGTVLAQASKTRTEEKPGAGEPRDPRARSRRMKFTG